MGINLEKIRENIHKVMANISQEEIDKYFPKDTRPKRWLSIEDHLPMFLAEDISYGGTVYKVKYTDGSEGHTMVSDHNAWYYFAKETGITHWYNK